MSNNPPQSRIVLGDASAEMRASQILALALSMSASWIADNAPALSDKPIPPLLQGAARAVSIASVAGFETPIEILALAARNTFELYIRLKHILVAAENSLAWREEAVTDQLQVYEGALTQDLPQQYKDIFNAERDRVKAHATNRGLQAGRIVRIADIARATGLEGEYRAFYKVYSKFIHPSSFLTNWPVAASTPMYRNTFVFNLQVYGNLILNELDQTCGLPVAEILAKSEQQLDEKLKA